MQTGLSALNLNVGVALLQYTAEDASAAASDKRALATTTKSIIEAEKGVHASSAKSGSGGVKDAVKKTNRDCFVCVFAVSPSWLVGASRVDASDRVGRRDGGRR